MKKSVLLLGLLLGSLYAAAQQPATVATGKKVEYFDDHNQRLPSKEGARYRVESEPLDSLVTIQRRYSAGGQLESVTRYAGLRIKRQEGPSEEYYASGQLKLRTNYTNGRLEGELTAYYPDGQLKRREQYSQYKSLGGECFDPKGKPVAFFPYIVFPEYEGGISALIQAEQQANVLVDFIVDKAGRVKNARVRTPLFPLLDAEALRVVNSLKRWKPGQVEGVPSDISFTLPVTFVLQ